MYSKILVPLDGSDVAECVLPHVEALAAANQAVAVTFLYVVQPLDTPMVEHKFKSQIESEAKSAAEHYLKNLISKLEYKEKAHGEVILGKAAEGIVDYAAENKMGLVLMSSHGLSGISRWISGSITDKVLHESKVPILRINASASREAFYNKGQKMTVLVLLDGSELAEAVLDPVQEMAKQFGPESVDIVLLRVCELFAHPHHHYPPPMSLSWEEYLEYETKKCKGICLTYLDKIKKRLKKDGLNVRSQVPVGNPADAIVEYINKNPVNLIALSTHGRTGISQWAFGSVANKIMHGASTPVLLIRCTRH